MFLILSQECIQFIDYRGRTLISSSEKYCDFGVLMCDYQVGKENASENQLHISNSD
jgi:hypothetical protein